MPADALAASYVAGITDANATVRLRLHAELFESLNRLWEQAQASRGA